MLFILGRLLTDTVCEMDCVMFDSKAMQFTDPLSLLSVSFPLSLSLTIFIAVYLSLLFLVYFPLSLVNQSPPELKFAFQG